MNISVRWRLVMVAAVVALSVWIIYPPTRTIKLGLDLNGGAHLLLRVKTGDVRVANDTVQEAIATIERRVNALGVAEATVARYGQQNQILVELPGVADVDRAKEIIKSTSQLRLTLVEGGPFQSREAAFQAYGAPLPSHLELIATADSSQTNAPVFYAVHKAAAVTGSDVRDVRQSTDEFNRPAVHFTLKTDAARRFGEFTERNIGRGLATVLDNRVTAVATIHSRIDDQGQIIGLSHDEMIEQVITFRSGALPADMEYVEERTVGASLGAASIRSGVAASIGGLALVTLFMLAYYRLAGLNALASIALNLLILIAFAAYIPITMTLPGIAGLILTIGMGVDSNVLIFERIKEELSGARSARAAVHAGFDRVWITIVDTHVTSLIAAALLYQFGTTAIRGFATTLTIGLLANVFTAVFVSRTLFEVMLRFPAARDRATLVPRPIAMFKRPTFNFMRWSPLAMMLSLAIIGAGAVTVAMKGLPLGIDFSGGTLVIAEFPPREVTDEEVRAAVAPLPGNAVVQRYGPADEGRFLVRLPVTEGSSPDQILNSSVQQVRTALGEAKLPPFEIAGRELVSATIGKDLQRQGIYATLGSLAAITGYIAMRFRPSFALGGIAATLHDALVTLACLSWAGYDLSLNVTAALLTVIGYSVNDTIVIFDRVRENATARGREPLAEVINRSVNQTLSRTVITAGATLLAVLAVYLFGGEALRGFAFTMLVGIVSGTYSTVFIASAMAARLSKP